MGKLKVIWSPRVVVSQSIGKKFGAQISKLAALYVYMYVDKSRIFKGVHYIIGSAQNKKKKKQTNKKKKKKKKKKQWLLVLITFPLN